MGTKIYINAGLVLLVCFFFCGCYEREYGKVLSEKATVIGHVFTPAHDEISYSSESYYSFGKRRCCRSVRHVDHIPDKWVTVFQCIHGTFETHRKDIYAKVQLSQRVDVTYRGIYAVKHQDGKEISREIEDLDLLDVWPNGIPKEANGK